MSEPMDSLRTSIATPDRRDAEAALAEAERLFRRTLASWASDLLLLRRSGAGRAVWAEPSSEAGPSLDAAA